MGSLSIGLNAGVQMTAFSGRETDERAALRPGSVADGDIAAGERVRSGSEPTSPRPVDPLGPGGRANLIRSGGVGGSGADGPDGLTDAERDQVAELRARDAEVRRHEEAHARVGGQYAGQPSYTYQTGPDGKRYAIGGEVAIDVAPVPDDPKATIAKMAIVKRAALAPAEPSGQDRRVAALADRQSLEAQAELNAQRLEVQVRSSVDLSGDEANSVSRDSPSYTPEPLIVRAVANLSRGDESAAGQRLARVA